MKSLITLPDMKAVTVINVDPGRRPAGALVTESGLRSVRMSVLRQSSLLARRKSGRVLRRIFGSTSLRSMLSGLLLVARISFGAWLLILGLTGMIHSGVSALSLGMVISGVAVASGFFTRLILGVCAAVVAFLILQAYMGGMVNMTLIIVFALMALFAATGPGRYSCDAMMCCRIFRAVRRRQLRILMQRRFSYRANEYARMM